MRLSNTIKEKLAKAVSYQRFKRDIEQVLSTQSTLVGYILHKYVPQRIFDMARDNSNLIVCDMSVTFAARRSKNTVLSYLYFDLPDGTLIPKIKPVEITEDDFNKLCDIKQQCSNLLENRAKFTRTIVATVDRFRTYNQLITAVPELKEPLDKVLGSGNTASASTREKIDELRVALRKESK